MVEPKVKRLSFFLVALLLIALAEPGVAGLFDPGPDRRNLHMRDNIIRYQAQASCVGILDFRIAASLKMDLASARKIAHARCRLLTELPTTGPAPQASLQ